MKHRYFYIDSENVNADAWVAHLAKLRSTDTVLVFYSNHSKSIPITMINNIKKSPCDIRLIVSTTGSPNAMDFVLCSVLGEYAYRCPKSKHVIISKDKGYNPVVIFWSGHKIDVDRIENIGSLLYNEC